MNKYRLFSSLSGTLPQLRNRIALYSMLDKAPTINPEPDPIEIEDKPVSKITSSYAAKVYVQNVNKYNEFMKEQKTEFEIGKRHLANMMGRDPENFTQEDIDEAIEYLFPCGLHEKRALPTMKSPEEIFPPKKEAEFDETGRPFHYLFYTCQPHFFDIVHNCVDVLKDLDLYEDKVNRGEIKHYPEGELFLESSKWISEDDLGKMCCEKIQSSQYQYLITTLERIIKHPFSKRAEQFIMKYRIIDNPTNYNFQSEPDSSSVITLEDGRKMFRTEFAQKKNAIAFVNVYCPGTGKFIVNGISYTKVFTDIKAREQLLFPLILAGMVKKVDVEAEIYGGGLTARPGAIRYGVAQGVAQFVSEEIREKMKLAGLLTREYRFRSRKIFGQKGNRAKWRWRKR